MQHRFTRYRILEIPASGTFGIVCIAEDSTGEKVAIKVLRLERGADFPSLKRARDEARLLSRLEHPNLVRVEPVLQINGRSCLLMEYVEGLSLAQLLQRHPDGLPPLETLAMLRDAARGLDAAWNSPSPATGEPLRVVHRDIKPGNLMIDVGGRVRVVDFGLAKASFADREAESAPFVPGSRGYMAPERYDGHDTPKGDVYALGLTLIELLTGHKPVLSLQPLRHDAKAASAWTQLTAGRALGVNPAGLRDLYLDLLAFEPEARPDPSQIADRIDDLLHEAGCAPDLAHFASTVVRPYHAARTQLPPTEHPRFRDLRFLEEDPSPDGISFDPSLEVRRFVDDPDFARHAGEVATLLVTHPDTDLAPLLQLLDRAAAPRWQFWRATPSRHRTLAALQAVGPIHSRAVVRRAQRLSHHRDPDIARAARELIERAHAPR